MACVLREVVGCFFDGGVDGVFVGDITWDVFGGWRYVLRRRGRDVKDRNFCSGSDELMRCT